MFRVIGAESKQLHFFVGSEDRVKYPECQDYMSRDGRREGFSRVGPSGCFRGCQRRSRGEGIR
jgi:hypothetical protein